MKTTIVGNPDYGELNVVLGPGEQFHSESGAMSRMSSGIEVKARLMGGFFRSIIRKLFGGESFFISEYTASKDAMLSLSPSHPGSIVQRTLNGETFHLTAGAFLGCTPGVEMAARFGGFKALFSGEGAFFLECSGKGDLFFDAFGGVIEKEIDGTLTVDTGHLVAWESSLDYTIGGMGGIKSTLFSGEGLVMKFSGRGKIYLQTRTLSGMAGWLSPYCRG